MYSFFLSLHNKIHKHKMYCRIDKIEETELQSFVKTVKDLVLS